MNFPDELDDTKNAKSFLKYFADKQHLKIVNMSYQNFIYNVLTDDNVIFFWKKNKSRIESGTWFISVLINSTSFRNIFKLLEPSSAHTSYKIVVRVVLFVIEKKCMKTGPNFSEVQITHTQLRLLHLTPHSLLTLQSFLCVVCDVMSWKVFWL